MHMSKSAAFKDSDKKIISVFYDAWLRYQRLKLAPKFKKEDSAPFKRPPPFSISTLSVPITGTTVLYFSGSIQEETNMYYVTQRSVVLLGVDNDHSLRLLLDETLSSSSSSLCPPVVPSSLS